MRLINVKTGKLEQFHINKPPYAILSHTWGADEEEISFQDIENGNISGKEFGKFKLEKCCQQAKEDGLNYAWIDTCCIDKTNSVELNEAINSMYHWYQAANTCYAYLADVSTEDSTTNLAALQHSLWFTRGWTLQELLAPKDLVFYGRGWDYLGSKTQLAEVLGEITSIPPRFLLRNDALYEASIAQRMSWAARRRTKRVEDIAYSLLGIFNVMIPMIYGEGEKAFLRLQEEIMKKSTDDSILAWGLAANSDTPKVENFIMYGNVLAASPAAFANSGTVVSRGSSNATIESLGLVRGFLHARLPLHKHGGQTFGLLDCRPDHGSDAFVGIPLSRISPGIKSDEYMRPMSSEAIQFSASNLTITPTSVRIHEPERFKEAPTYNRRYGFRINVPSTGELELVDVQPQSRWEKEETEEPFIFSGVDFQVDSVQQTWVRLRHRRHEAPNPQDFVMVLELEVKDSQPQARCHVMIASRDTDLDAIVGLPGLSKHVFGKSTAGNGLLEVKATLNQDRMAMQQVFAVNLLAHPSLPGTPQSPSVTAELQLVEHTLNLQMVFKEDKQMRPKMETVPEILRESIASLQSREKRIEAVDKEMDQLQKQINQLQKQIKILQNEKHDLVKGLNKEAKHMQFLSQENNTLLERHTEIIQTVSSSRNLPESLGEKRATLWDEEMLDYFSDTLLSSDRLYDSLSDIQDRSQRIFMQAVDMGCLAVMRFLVSSMDNLLFEDSFGRNVLCRAIDNNISAAIWLIEESGIDSAHIDSRGVPALVAAAAEGHLSIVRSLLDHGQSVDVRDCNCDTPLSVAMHKGHIEVGRFLLKRNANVDGAPSIAGAPLPSWPPLVRAAAYGHLDCIHLLLESGANLESRNHNGETALACAASSGHHGIAQLLLDAGANIESKSTTGFTALMRAAGDGHLATSQMLLDRGADIHSQDDFYNALTEAVFGGHEDVVRMLVSRGANIECKTKFGYTPLIQAVIKGHETVVEVLLQQEANRGALDINGQSALFWATRTKNCKIMRLLLDHKLPQRQRGPAINEAAKVATKVAPNTEGKLDNQVNVPSSWSSAFHQSGVNTSRGDGRCAIHLAIEQGHFDAVHLLVDRGANTLVGDGFGRTPLELARNILRDPERKKELPELESIVELLEKTILPRRATSPRKRSTSPVPRGEVTEVQRTSEVIGSGTAKKRWWKS